MTSLAALATSFIGDGITNAGLIEMASLAAPKKRGGRSEDLPPLTNRHP
jgi:hypothetical protein